MIKTYLNHITLGSVSLTMILYVLISEHIFGFAPCSLCLLQRYPHILVSITSVWLIFFRTHNFFMYPLNALAMILSIILASYHVGVEQSIFQGPQSCSSSNLSLVSEISAEALLEDILNTSVQSKQNTRSKGNMVDLEQLNAEVSQANNSHQKPLTLS